MKPEPIDHLGRPRRSAGSSFWLLLQVLVGLAAGAVSGFLGAWAQQRFTETLWLAGPPLIIVCMLGMLLFALQRAGYQTGYLVIMGSFAVGMSVLFAAFALGLGIHLPL